MNIVHFSSPRAETAADIEHLKYQVVRARVSDFSLPGGDGTDETRRRASSDAQSALLRPRALLELVSHFPLGDSLRLEFIRHTSSWRFEVQSMRQGEDARNSQVDLDRVLTVVAPTVRFKAAPAPNIRELVEHTVRIAPRASLVASEGGKEVWLPSPDLAGADLTRSLALAVEYAVRRVSFVTSPLILDDRAIAALTLARFRLAGRVNSDAQTQSRIDLITAWIEARRGCEIVVELSRDEPLTSAELDLFSLALFGCAGPSAGSPDLDLRLAYPRGALPPWRFWPVAADLHRDAAVATNTPEGDGAVTLGLDVADEPIRLSSEDRMRHLFVLGGTGGGKSTLLSRQILEDIEHGEGVLLIDCHGDLADTVRAAIPRARRDDIVWLDVGDENLEWRLDLLSVSGIYPDAERNRIANQLVAYFRQVYSGTPEAFGPAFELFFRNTIFLLLLAKDEGDRSLTKFEDVLTDRAFRQKLLRACGDEKVRQFWEETAEQISGDWKLENMAPYIICKMNQLSGSPLTRRVIGGDRPKLDLRKAMDDRKIVLIRLSKGLIGEYDARFLGALFLMALSEAAMSRCRLPANERLPFRVFVDEFQTLSSQAAADMLAECRKYGLSLTLANQSLSQLGADWYSNAKVAQAALANCGNIAAFRVGLDDARVLAPMMDMESPRELTQLGVGEMLVRRLVGGVPMNVQRLMGLPPLVPNCADDLASARQPRHTR